MGAETPLQISGKNLSGRDVNWSREPSDPETNGAIAFREAQTNRAVYLGFSEASWEFDNCLELPKTLDTILAWLRREPSILKSAWTNDELSAQLLEMDTEDQFSNSLNFVNDLNQANIRGTLYSLTRVAKRHVSVVQELSERHEIGHHAEVHAGFKGKPLSEQEARLQSMVDDMREIVGSRALSKVTGFRAPTESWDATTEKLLCKYGIKHHVADPSSSEARLPFFSQSELGLNSEDAIVVLPRTQMDDVNYLALNLTIERASTLIKRDFDYLHEAGALGMLSVQSQNYGETGLMKVLTPPYIERLREHRKDMWSAPGQEIESWWKSRAGVQLAVKKEGNAGPLLQFSIQAPGNVRGSTFFVVHPSESKYLMAVVPENSNLLKPVIQKIDLFRSAIVFEQKLLAGSYSYKITF